MMVYGEKFCTFSCKLFRHMARRQLRWNCLCFGGLVVDLKLLGCMFSGFCLPTCLSFRCALFIEYIVKASSCHLSLLSDGWFEASARGRARLWADRPALILYTHYIGYIVEDSVLYLAGGLR